MFIKWEQASAAFCVTACRNPIISPADNLRAFRKIPAPVRISADWVCRCSATCLSCGGGGCESWLLSEPYPLYREIFSQPAVDIRLRKFGRVDNSFHLFDFYMADGVFPFLV